MTKERRENRDQNGELKEETNGELAKGERVSKDVSSSNGRENFFKISGDFLASIGVFFRKVSL